MVLVYSIRTFFVSVISGQAQFLMAVEEDEQRRDVYKQVEEKVKA
jgi:hypothetical protein